MVILKFCKKYESFKMPPIRLLIYMMSASFVPNLVPLHLLTWLYQTIAHVSRTIDSVTANNSSCWYFNIPQGRRKQFWVVRPGRETKLQLGVWMALYASQCVQGRGLVGFRERSPQKPRKFHILKRLTCCFLGRKLAFCQIKTSRNGQ